MSKILLVEDDNNLREIYEARLQAEGYDIVSARDGEEALTVAMKERPDLIISDVMMPKISGFDMLDIIRSTEETKNAKVIMMTALSQSEDKERAANLGADRYLVKSQVTLEDVAKVAREVLLGDSDDTSGTPTDTTTPTPPAVAQTPVAAVPPPEPPTTIPAVPDPAPVDNPVVIIPTPTVVQTPAPAPVVTDSTVAPAPSVDPVAPSEPITQVADNSTSSDSSSPAMAAINPAPVASIDEIVGDKAEAVEQSVEDEQSAIAAQIESFIEAKKTDPETPPEPTPPQAESVATKTPASVEKPTKEPAVTESTDENTVPDTSIISAPIADASEVKKKIIQPISDPTASKSKDLENLLKKEVEKEQMAEIAKAVVTEKADVADELTAEAALRSAARSPRSPAEEPNDDTPQVDITENGDLKVQAPPSIATPTDTQETAETPTVVPTVELSTPIIPHSNGSSIDGVVQHEAQPAPEQPIAPTQPPKTGSDPEAIAL